MSEWQIVSLESVAKIERDGINPSDIVSGTAYVGLENIESGGAFVNVRDVDRGELASNKFLFTEQHVLYGKLRPYLAKIARPEFQGICSTDILPILPGKNLDRNYLTHFLRQPSMIDLATARSAGANLPRLSPKVLAEFQIPLPPIGTQKRIAAILDQAEALRSLRRQSIGQLDALARSVFLEMFGNPVTNPKGNKVVRLADVATRITDGVHQKPNYVESGIPFISVKDITTGTLKFGDCKFISQEEHSKFTKRCRPELHDILYTKVGATYGRPAIVNTDREFSIYVSVCLIKPKRELINPFFLCFALGTSAVKNQADRRIKGIGVPDLHLDQIQNFLIPLPSMSEQQEFTDRIQAIEALKAQHRESLAKMDTLFNSLQHRAFRGEL
jgi:type I restriction enzyme, S subunit